MLPVWLVPSHLREMLEVEGEEIVSEIKDGGPAFPEAYFENDPGGIGQGILYYPGLTKREWFAGMALKGLLSNRDYIVQVGKVYDAPTAVIAEQSFEMADAMLKEGEKK